MSVVLPQNITFDGKQWSLSEAVTPESNFSVDYVHATGLFPVSFTAETSDEARLLMLAWLQDEGVA